ncbi:Conserved_hypothetical protein [Hexamita inflata]|uniref:Uncharacterized protein n=1 Tax=Hexamita inflata TaxID=28002 RepID=A0AA86QC47_9EUKA|nr:Conserved hypothetical protein [Hexamita inflata]
MYTQRTQDLQLKLTYSMQSLQSFALFGLTTNIQVQSSNVSVKVPQDLANGSLLCFLCDVNASSSDFTFIASGQNITGFVQAPLTILKINQSLVQFRLNGVNIGGLILNASEIQVSIVDCNISGFVIDDSVSGSIITFVYQQVDFGVKNVKICSNVPYFGQGALSQQGIVDTCVLCRDGFYTYGLCLASLQFSEIQNDKLVCINSFTFDGEKCSCAEGQILNGTTCIEVLYSINSLSSQQILVQNQVADLTNRTQALDNISRELTDNLSHTNQLIYNIQQDQIVNSVTVDHNIIGNITSLNQTLLNNVATLNALIQNLQAQIDLLQNKQDKLPLEMLNNMFQQENYEATELWIICGQPAFIQTFDITSVTNTIISSNFTNGSVFGQKINVQNVFIDIQDGVYGSVVQPLFAAQNQFYNIKVRIGNQIVGSGQILSSNNSIIINLMTILSKIGTTVTINSLLSLNILLTQSVSITIKDVKIQLNIQASTGNLGLVGSLIGQMSIINYQVSGTYETLGMMSLGVQTMSSSKVLIKRVNFAPFSYVYGNQSSFLFGIITSSSIEIAKSVMTIGNQSTQFILGSLTTTNTLFQQFGGLVSQMIMTRLVVVELFQTSNFTCSTQYMTKSGIMLGISTTSSSQVIFKGICIKFSIVANTNLSQFGVIGYLDGNITIQQTTIVSNISAVIINCLGVIGNISASSLLANFLDLTLQEQIHYTSGGTNSALIGQLYAVSSTFTKIKLNNSVQNGTGIYGGFIAISNSDISITDSVINNLTIISTSSSSAVTGQSINNLITQNIIVINIISNSSNSVGTIIGFSNAQCSVQSSQIINISISSLIGVGSGSLIGYSSLQTIIDNCHSENINIYSTTNGTGGMVGWANFSLIINCYVLNVQINSTLYIGGICGIQNNNSEIRNSQVINSYIKGSQSGGISGVQRNNSEIVSCISENNTIESSSSNAGSIIATSLIFTQILNSSSLNCSVTSTGSVTGGIFGFISSVLLDTCFVSDLKTVSGSQSGGVIGITGTLGSIQIQNVFVHNIFLQCLTGTSIGSIIGYLYVDSIINGANIKNVQMITQSANGAGGVVGSSSANVQIVNCIVENLNINSTSTGSGGIIGHSNITSIINCSVSNSFINSTDDIGGVLGYQQDSSINNQILIQNVSVRNITLNSSSGYTGGFIGHFSSSTQALFIKVSIVSNILINSSSQIGIIVGKSDLASYSVTNSSSQGVNKINNIIQSNCDNLIFIANQRGC